MIVIKEENRHKQGGRIDMCKRVEMICVSVLAGDGTQEWPYRHEVSYFDLDGNFKWKEKFE